MAGGKSGKSYAQGSSFPGEVQSLYEGLVRHEKQRTSILSKKLFPTFPLPSHSTCGVQFSAGLRSPSGVKTSHGNPSENEENSDQ